MQQGMLILKYVHDIDEAMARYLMRFFVGVMAVLYLFRITAKATYSDWRGVVDPIFWLSGVGLFVCYFWYKKLRKNA